MDPILTPKCKTCPAFAKSAFANLNNDELADLNSIRSEFPFNQDDELSLSRENSRGCLCVRSGHVRVGLVDGRDKTLIHVAGEGDLIGYGDWFFTNSPHHTAQALDKGKACYFDGKKLTSLLEKRPSICSGISKMLCKIIAVKDKRIVGLENMTAKSRVASILSNLIEKFGIPTPEGVRIDIRLERKSMAEMACTTSETFARVLSELEREQILRREGRTILAMKPSDLKQIAGN